MPLPALAGVALQHGLTGLEFGVAIPASLGGAVRMNAGAHARCSPTSWRGRSSSCWGPADRAAHRQGMAFVYRGSGLPGDAVVVGATLRLEGGDPAEYPRRDGAGAGVAPCHPAARGAELRQRLQEPSRGPRGGV